MNAPHEYSFVRYLAAKKSVDDRALNRHVWETLASGLPAGTAASPLRALEIGAGIGTMLERALDWELLTNADYTAIDAQAENIATARQRLVDWSSQRGCQAVKTGDRLMLERMGQRISVDLEAADLFDFIRRHQGRRAWDLVIAHAFLDLVDIPSSLPKILSLLSPGGLFYFTINFDGATLLEPLVDPVFDDLVQQLYHRTMDERITGGAASGDSRAGRHLFAHLIQAQAEILDAGASDWVVFPQAGRYPADEAYFLHFILHTLYTALRGHPELDTRRFEAWTARRHQQVEQGELVYIAHQIDFVGKYPQSRVGD